MARTKQKGRRNKQHGDGNVANVNDHHNTPTISQTGNRDGFSISQPAPNINTSNFTPSFSNGSVASQSNSNTFTPSFPTMDAFMAASFQSLNNGGMTPPFPLMAGAMSPSNTGFTNQRGPSNPYAAPMMQMLMQNAQIGNNIIQHYQVPMNPGSQGYSMSANKSAVSNIDGTKLKNSSSRRQQLPVSAPSAASGGVPEPTPAYLLRASFLPQRRVQPGPLLVVIDLNGTLLHRPNHRNSSSFEERVHAKRFVEYCVQTFWVVIWSSARPENVQRMVNKLIDPQIRNQIVAIWGRDKFGLSAADYNARTQCYKRLTTVWNDSVVKAAFPRARPGFEKACWDQGNTVLIDDSSEKARSEPHNAITLPEFKGQGTDGEMLVLPRVHDYLNELCYHEDASAYMRANPFKMS